MENTTIVIYMPATCSYDIHICGMCHGTVHSVESFIDHKRGCLIQNEKNKGNIQFNESMPVLRFADPPDKSVIVRNEPVILRTSVGNKGEQRFVSMDDYMNQANKSDAVTQISEEDQVLISSPSPDDKQPGTLEKSLPTSNEKKVWIEYRGCKRLVIKCVSEGCSYTSFFKKDMDRHCRIHTGERPFKCQLCDKMFTRSDKLQIHQRIHMGDKRYKCSECDYAAVESGSLLKHQRIHNGQRPFKCQLCPYSAKDKSQLTVHLRMHTGDSPYVCEQDKCNAAFKTNSDLKRHMRTHSGVKPFPCQLCPFKASLRGGLLSHTKKKHAQKVAPKVQEFPCSHCPKTIFRTVRRLHNHLKAKHKIQVENSQDSGLIESNKKKLNRKIIQEAPMRKHYQCDDCHASFVCPENLRVHVTHHLKSKKTFPCEDACNLEEEEKSMSDLSGLEKRELTLPMVLTDNSWAPPADMDVDIKTAEILASLADGMQLTKTFADLPPGFFPSDEDLQSSQENMRFLDAALF